MRNIILINYIFFLSTVIVLSTNQTILTKTELNGEGKVSVVSSSTVKAPENLSVILENDTQLMNDINSMVVTIKSIGLSKDELIKLSDDSLINKFIDNINVLNDKTKSLIDKMVKEKRSKESGEKFDLSKKEIKEIIQSMKNNETLKNVIKNIKSRLQQLNISDDDLKNIQNYSGKDWKVVVRSIFNVEAHEVQKYSQPIKLNDTDLSTLTSNDIEKIGLSVGEWKEILKDINDKKIEYSLSTTNKIKRSKDQDIQLRGDKLTMEEINKIRDEINTNIGFRKAFQEMMEDIRKLNLTKKDLLDLSKNTSNKWKEIEDNLVKSIEEREKAEEAKGHVYEKRKKRNIVDDHELVKIRNMLKNDPKFNEEFKKLLEDVKNLEKSDVELSKMVINTKRFKRYLELVLDEDEEIFDNIKPDVKSNRIHQRITPHTLPTDTPHDAFIQKSPFEEVDKKLNVSYEKEYYNKGFARDVLKFISLIYFPIIYMALGFILCYIINSSMSAAAAPKKVYLTTDA
uniref:Exported protein n=1 Tax=Parastrongyloides trichosuri TaxID=131310 RepID=A0A0N4ZFA8_PARTI